MITAEMEMQWASRIFRNTRPSPPKHDMLRFGKWRLMGWTSNYYLGEQLALCLASSTMLRFGEWRTGGLGDCLGEKLAPCLAPNSEHFE